MSDKRVSILDEGKTKALEDRVEHRPESCASSPLKFYICRDGCGAMHVRHFESHLWLPQPRSEVFAFFSDPQNLDLITPPWLHFRTISQCHDHMQQDTVMDHRLRIHGFPLRWRSKITDWDPPARFVDEQIHGPYQLWIHEHRFEERSAGTLVHDHVRYAVPFDFLIHRFFIRPDIERIFSYRSDRLRRLFAVAA